MMNFRPLRLVFLGLLCVSALVYACAPESEPSSAVQSPVQTNTAPPPPAVLTQRNDNARSATYTQPGFNTSLVQASSWGLLGVLPVYGAILAQPLYVPSQTIAGGTTHNVLYVATGMNQVTAFDADTLALLWQHNFAGPDLAL